MLYKFYFCIYSQVADIRGNPFSVDVDALVYLIRNVMEEYGCLIGGFELDDTWDHYRGVSIILSVHRYLIL